VIVNQIQGGRWDTFIRRLLPIKDRSIAPIFASELVGQVVVQEWEPEFYKLRDENLCIGLAAQAGVAAEFTHVKLRNPIGSGNLVVLEEVWFRPAAGVSIEMAQVISVATVGFTNQATAFRDMRAGGLPGVGVTVAQVSIETNVAPLGGTAIARLQPLATDTMRLKLTMVLPPNSEIIFRALTVNVGMQVTFLWRERGAEPSELLI